MGGDEIAFKRWIHNIDREDIRLIPAFDSHKPRHHSDCIIWKPRPVTVLAYFVFVVYVTAIWALKFASTAIRTEL